MTTPGFRDVQTKLVEVANTERIVDLQVERIGVARSALEDIEKQVEQDQQLICNNNAIVKELEEARRRIQQKSVGSQTEAQK